MPQSKLFGKDHVIALKCQFKNIVIPSLSCFECIVLRKHSKHAEPHWGRITNAAFRQTSSTCLLISRGVIVMLYNIRCFLWPIYLNSAVIFIAKIIWIIILELIIWIIILLPEDSYCWCTCSVTSRNPSRTHFIVICNCQDMNSLLAHRDLRSRRTLCFIRTS